MQSGTIVVRKAGTFPPNLYWEKVLAANTTGWGAGTLSEVDGKKFLEVLQETNGATLEEIQDNLKTFPDQDIHFYFCHSEPGLSKVDVSPHVIIETICEEDADESEPRVLAFIEGNFPGSAQASSSHPPEYHLCVDYLIPKIEGMWEMLDGDIDKVTEQMEKPFFKKELLLQSVSRGVIHLVCSNGKALTFQNNDMSAEYPWGWVSNTHGYVEGDDKKEPPKSEKKKGGLLSRSTVRERAVPEKSAVAVKPPVTETAVIKNFTVRRWKPSDNDSRSKKKDQYKMRLGYLPRGWVNGVEVDIFVDPQGKDMTFRQVQDLGLAAAAVMQLAKNPPADHDKNNKDTDPEHIPQPEQKAQSSSGAVVAEVLPLMSPKSREAVNNIHKQEKYKKIVDANHDVIKDPKQIEALEQKFADFSRQMGATSMAEFATWSPEMELELCKNDPVAAMVMLDTFKNLCAKHGLFVKKEPISDAAPDTAAAETVAPKRKGGLLSRASAA